MQRSHSPDEELADFRLELGNQSYPLSPADPHDVTLDDDALNPGWMSFGVSASDSRALATQSNTSAPR